MKDCFTVTIFLFIIYLRSGGLHSMPKWRRWKPWRSTGSEPPQFSQSSFRCCFTFRLRLGLLLSFALMTCPSSFPGAIWFVSTWGTAAMKKENREQNRLKQLDVNPSLVDDICCAWGKHFPDLKQAGVRASLPRCSFGL